MIIKLGPAPQSASAAAASPSRLRVVLPGLQLGGTTANTSITSTTVPQPDILRAVAAAAASKEPGKARQFAKEAIDEPGKPYAEYDTAAAKAAAEPVFLAVIEARDSRSTKAPDDVGQAVARAVGANPPLVAAAQDALVPGAGRDACLWWVAMLDKELLAKAGEAAIRATVLKLPSPASKLDAIKAEVAQVKAALVALDPVVTGLKTKLDNKVDVDAFSNTVRAADEKFAQIDSRIHKLEMYGGGRGNR